MKKLAFLFIFAVSSSLSFAATQGFKTTPVTFLSDTGSHLKKDGTVDKRYKGSKTNTANKPASATKGPVSAASSSPAGAKTKADGTVDKRYKANKTTTAPTATSIAKRSPAQSVPSAGTNAGTATHLKKDGTPDMRYKANRTGQQDKNGTSDKRYKDNKTPAPPTK